MGTKVYNNLQIDFRNAKLYIEYEQLLLKIHVCDRIVFTVPVDTAKFQQHCFLCHFCYSTGYILITVYFVEICIYIMCIDLSYHFTYILY